MICLVPFKFRPPLQVKNQHLTALNKRRRLECCTAMLEWLCEAKKQPLGTIHTLGFYFDFFTMKLRCFRRFMVLVQLRRRVGKQTPAPPRRRLLRLFGFLAARAAQPSEHEDLLGVCLVSQVCFSFSQVLAKPRYKCRFQSVPLKDLAIAQLFKD